MQDYRTPVALRGGIRNMEIGTDYAGSTVGDTFTFWFSPQPVRESIRVAYEEAAVIGMSHAYKTYSNTANVAWSFELYVDRVMLLADRDVLATLSGATNAALAAYIEGGRRFLEALQFAAARPGNLPGIGDAPPVCLLSLPGICTDRVRVLSVDFEFTRIDPALGIRELRAQLAIEGAPLSRITMQDVLERGMFRGGEGR